MRITTLVYTVFYTVFTVGICAQELATLPSTIKEAKNCTGQYETPFKFIMQHPVSMSSPEVRGEEINCKKLSNTITLVSYSWNFDSSKIVRFQYTTKRGSNGDVPFLKTEIAVPFDRLGVISVRKNTSEGLKGYDTKPIAAKYDIALSIKNGQNKIIYNNTEKKSVFYFWFAGTDLQADILAILIARLARTAGSNPKVILLSDKSKTGNRSEAGN